jgi:hypothetical protein
MKGLGFIIIKTSKDDPGRDGKNTPEVRGYSIIGCPQDRGVSASYTKRRIKPSGERKGPRTSGTFSDSRAAPPEDRGQGRGGKQINSPKENDFQISPKRLTEFRKLAEIPMAEFKKRIKENVIHGNLNS